MARIMRNKLLGRILAVGVLAACLAASRGWGDSLFGPSQAQKIQQTSTIKQDEDEQAPIATFDEPVPAKVEERSRRLEKGKYFNNLNLVSEQLPGVEIRQKSDHWHLGFDSIPVGQSDVILTGTVIDAKAYLSNDKKGVYSEFAVTVDEVIKNKGQASVGSNQTILIERLGGSVRFPSGNVQRIHAEAGQKLPQLGTRYLFFLKSEDGGQILTILTGYELRQGQIYALDKIDKFQTYNGSNEFTFLNRVRQQP